MKTDAQAYKPAHEILGLGVVRVLQRGRCRSGRCVNTRSTKHSISRHSLGHFSFLDGNNFPSVPPKGAGIKLSP